MSFISRERIVYIMIVEPCSSTSLLSNNHRTQKYLKNRFHMSMNKPSIKQNNHLSTNENRTDDDYGGGGNSEICSKITNGDNRKSRSNNHNRGNDPTRWWLVHFIQRFIADPKRTLTRSRSATDATRFLRHIQTRISPAIKCDSVYEESSTNTKRRNNNCDQNQISLYTRMRSQSVPINSICSPNHQLLSLQRQAGTLTRSSSVHDLHRHEVFRANELDFGPIIGQGFYGIARTVTFRKTGQIMVMKETKTFDKEAQKIFVKEVQVLKRLKHPNVLHFMGLLLDKDNQMCFLVDYIAGGTLKNIIHDLSIPLTWLQRLRYAKDIAAGMEYLHSCNIIHRDLNSSNCLVKSNGQVVVADFGLSRINLDEDDDYVTTQMNDGTSSSLSSFRRDQRSTSTTITSNGNIVVVRPKTRRQILKDRQRYTVVGSPYWMAPEMLKGQCYDERVDIFSFGIMLCEIIGRVQADPDYLPRTQDFGLNVHLFNQKYCSKDCPKQFIAIAIACCDINPDSRPAFCVSHPWLEALALSVETGYLQEKKFIIMSCTKVQSTNQTINNFSAAVLPSSTCAEGGSVGRRVLASRPNGSIIKSIEFAKTNDDKGLQIKHDIIHQFLREHNLSWSITLHMNILYVQLPKELCAGSKEKFVSLLEFADDTLHCKKVIIYFNKARSDRAIVVKTFMFLGFHVLSPDNTLMQTIDKQAEELYMVYLIDGDE
ncbi:unnamed protein product [Rotaria sordida]|uniref:Protein kinase domain-containing protein n=1 Tax=Rotaria sordida TaxID=392033 RepID=A0A815DFY5_9BILA|nr:unnamed protein product [Rotaria sordida]